MKKLISHEEAEARKKAMVREIAEILHPGRRYGEVYTITIARTFPSDKDRTVVLPYVATAKDMYDGFTVTGRGTSELHALRTLRAESKKRAEYWEFMRSR